MRTSFILGKSKRLLRNMGTTSIALSEVGMKEIPPAMTQQALSDAGQIIINSTKVGYLREKSPSGEAWAKNPEWYKMMKGGAAILTGSTKASITDGKWKGYKFKKVNTKRMKNALMKTVTSTKVTVEYERDVQKRAEINQLGGKSVMKVESPTGRTVEIDIMVQKREHLGVAEDWARLGNKTDVEHIEEIFGKLIDFVIL